MKPLRTGSYKLHKFCFKVDNQDGAVLIWVVVGMVMFISIIALAIDAGHLFGVRGELQNAADAAALSGAQFLFDPDDANIVNGVAVGINAVQVAEEFNHTGKGIIDAEVWVGHWSFTDTDLNVDPASWRPVNQNYSQYSGWETIDETVLDTEQDFFNAVKVITIRNDSGNNDTPAFFAIIFKPFFQNIGAEAVAYLGFSGSLMPGDVDQPIAICEDKIIHYEDGTLDCTTGRFINSNDAGIDQNSGAWSTLNTVPPEESCDMAGGTSTVLDLVSCDVDAPGETNVGELILGYNLSLITGQTSATESHNPPGLFPCFVEYADAVDGNANGIPEIPWTLKLPLIDCCGGTDPCDYNNVPNCAPLVGAVAIDLVWVVTNENDVPNPDKVWDPAAEEGKHNKYQDVPRKMGDWTCELVVDLNDAYVPLDNVEGKICWDDFVDNFELKASDGSPAPYLAKALYFLPNCTGEELGGKTGGPNRGVMAAIPVLVNPQLE